MINRAEASSQATLVDIHHHMIPPGYPEALAEAGWKERPFPEWSPSRSLSVMDRCGIVKAFLSLPSPGTWLGRDDNARSLARSCNEWGASLARQHPDRFGVLAALPFPDLEGAIQELVYALDTLGADGVILFSNVQGRYVGDPEFDPLMTELHRNKALVLLHPNGVEEDDGNAPLYPWAEYPIDLARAWARLVFNDTLVRYPGIRWVLGHAGGVVPFMADRLGKAHYAKVGGFRWGRILKDLLLKRHGGLELARRVDYDTVGATNPVTLTCLQRLVEPERIRFGSNLPWATEESVAASIHFLQNGKTESPLVTTLGDGEGVAP